MALIKASGYTNPSPDSIITTSGRLDILRRELREFSLNPSDGVEMIPEVDSGDVIIDFDSTYQIGSETVIELQDKERDVLDTFTTTDSSGTHTFLSVDSSASFVVGYIRNSDGFRVSNYFVRRIVVGSDTAHDSLPSWADAGSGHDQSFVNTDQSSIEGSSAKEVADVILDIWRGKDSSVEDVEQHVDIIFGALTFEAKKFSETLLENSAKTSTSTDLFPLSWTELYPKPTSWSKPSTHSYEESTPKNIQEYDSPHGGSSRTAGDQSEWQDLEDAKDNASNTETLSQTSIDSTNGVYTYDGTLSASDIEPGTVSITDDSDSISITDDGNGNLTGDVSTAGDAPNTIDYSTGDYHFDVDQSQPINDGESLEAKFDANDFSVDVFNETEGQDETYTSLQQLNDRQNEIESIVVDFNDLTELWNTYDDRYDWADLYTNRQVGYRFNENMETQGQKAFNEERDAAVFLEQSVGLT